MVAVWVPEGYPQGWLEEDANALGAELHIVEAWPGSVVMHEYKLDDGIHRIYFDGTAIRVRGAFPANAAGIINLIRPDQISRARAAQPLRAAPGSCDSAVSLVADAGAAERRKA